MTRKPALVPLARTFPLIERWLGGAAGGRLPRTRADLLADLFGLDPFARALVLLGAYDALEPAAGPAIARAQGGPPHSRPTLGLALGRLPGANWAAVAADAPLRRWQLIQLLDGDTGLIGARFRLSEPVLFYLMGAPALGDGLASLLRPVPDPAALVPSRARLAGQIAARLDLPGAPVLHLTGGDPAGKLEAFARAAAIRGEAAYALDAALIPVNPADLIALAGIVERDLRLLGGRLILDHPDLADARATRLFAEAYRAPLAIAATDALRVGHRPAHRLEMPVMTAAEQVPVWREGLGALAGRLNGSLDLLAATFRVSPELARSVGAEMAMTVDASGPPEGGEDKDLARRAWAACRRAARPRMDDLAQRIDGAAAWDDLVLPPRQKAMLRTITAQVRNRARVYEDWGFAPRLQNRGLGVSALFSGPSGAGKTMAGEVIGTELALDVYRVDLSAMVSKWLGETEKNLRRVFDAAEDGGVILQFDEADALFGRRSEVRDSHDRHANIEVSYLLQRLEAYRGLCILTTNLRDNIDESFLRRIRFVVEFRFPGRAERIAIWQRAFPCAAPVGPLDYDALGRLNVSGGSIRNIALAASFMAAEDGGPVTMPLLYQAALQEYDKAGRTLTDAERAGWPS